MSATDDRDNEWHLDKKVPISIILAIAMQFVGGLWVVADIKKDVEVLKAGMSAQHDRDERQDSQQAAALALVRADIQELSRKLDRLIEKKP